MDIDKFLKDIIGKHLTDIKEYPEHYRLRRIIEGEGIPVGIDKYRITMLIKNKVIVFADIF